MRIAAIGRTQMLVDTIGALQAGGHQVVQIVTCRARPGQQVGEEHFRTLAQSLGAEFIATQNLNDPAVVARLREARAEVGVSIDWVNLVGQDACASFPHGILNAHGGDLPRYRGNAPVPWAILRGEPHVGLTIHRMEPGEYDSGPILIKEYFPLGPGTYVRQVFDFIESRLPGLFIAAVGALETGEARFVPQSQDPAAVLRCYPRVEADGWIDWHQPAENLARLVRASSEPYAGAFTTYRGQRLTVWRARAERWPVETLAVPGSVTGRDSASGEVSVATGSGALVLEEVETSTSGRGLPLAAIRGTRDRLGVIPRLP